MNAYELGQRRVPVSALLTLVWIFRGSLKELLGEDTATTKKRGPAPKPRQRMVMEMIEAVLAQPGR